ncbi:MAG TPA: hypothetical protein VG733_16710 [Chthoniobacteraceae bacterium]|nr:hypothetical protein [Chthoniobacteraceae bacterium]
MSDELKIAVRKQPPQFQPGEEIAGAAQWQLKHPPKTVEVRLLWRTLGRGIEDACVVSTVQFDAPLADDTHPFTLVAPDAPYSFAGSLITLQWSLELVALPSKKNAHIDIVIAPGGAPVDLRSETAPKIA